MTQGRPGSREWITSLLISYSLDYYQWSYITDSDGNQNIFTANHDAVSVRYQYFRISFITRFIRFHVVSWHIRPSLRLELIGCPGKERTRVIYFCFKLALTFRPSCRM